MTKQNHTGDVAQDASKRLKLAEKYARILDRAKTMRRSSMQMRVFEDDMEYIIAALRAPVPIVPTGNPSEIAERLRWEALESSGSTKGARKAMLAGADEIDCLAAAPRTPAAYDSAVFTKRLNEANAEIASWRRVAERLETEKQQALAQVERLPASVALALSSEREKRVKEQHKDVLPIYLYGFDDATEAALAALPHTSTVEVTDSSGDVFKDLGVSPPPHVREGDA